MAKRITRIVLTGGPAAGKTTLTSRILKEFKQDDGWRVITIPETATELMAGFGIRPFGGCVSMLEFQSLLPRQGKDLENTTFSRFFLCPNAQFSPMFSPYRLDAAFFVL